MRQPEARADFSNLSVFSHIDLSRGGDYPARFERMASLADAAESREGCPAHPDCGDCGSDQG